jgi:GNAT superfamily N-acetyltransferase
VGADLEALVGVVEATRDIDGYPPHWPPDAPGFLASRRELAAFVAVDHGVVVGHVGLHDSAAPAVTALARAETGLEARSLACVARLVVDSAARRRGAGRSLLATAVSRAHSLDRRPMLDVATHFRRAISLYESEGWQRLGEVTIEFRSPCSASCTHEGDTVRSYVYLGPPAGDVPRLHRGGFPDRS